MFLLSLPAAALQGAPSLAHPEPPPIIFWHIFCKKFKNKEGILMAEFFFYFLIVCEIAILGLLIWGIFAKVRSILKNYYLPLDD